MTNDERINYAMRYFHLEDIKNPDEITIKISGFDLKLIITALMEERHLRLQQTGWKNLTPGVYPPQYGYDHNAKPVRQVDSVINHIKKQTIKE